MADITLNTRFGELSFDSSKIITFPQGIPGFEKNKRWALFHELNEQGEWVSGVVVHLQSIDDGSVSLPLTDPGMFGFNYELALSDSEVAALKLDDPSDAVVLATLSSKNMDSQGKGETSNSSIFANISAPIIINMKSCLGMQKILDGKQSQVDVVIKA